MHILYIGSGRAVARIPRVQAGGGRRVWVHSIPAVARRGGFRDEALLGVWIVTEHMPAMGAGSKPAGAMRVRGDHVAQHVCFAPKRVFEGGSDGNRVPGAV